MICKNGQQRKNLGVQTKADKTLASHDLSNGEAIKCRLKNELLHSYMLKILWTKVGRKSCLDMLRSVGHGDWKDLTPLHSLLVEGFVDGPMDVLGLFHRWWPQFNFPTFKIIESKKRMKCAWPLSAREVVVHCFEVDFSEDDLLIFVLNSVTDTKSVDRSTHGFTNDGMPEVKVTSNRSYFRTIMTMDMKLDFVPPSLINFCRGRS
ncbi:hypothetical protein MKW92_040901 [Papaver armeniacum]|nr:hypothetical protein MKW92_040901 [Papaver armeniacum]